MRQCCHSNSCYHSNYLWSVKRPTINKGFYVVPLLIWVILLALYFHGPMLMLWNMEQDILYRLYIQRMLWSMLGCVAYNDVFSLYGYGHTKENSICVEKQSWNIVATRLLSLFIYDSYNRYTASSWDNLEISGHHISLPLLYSQHTHMHPDHVNVVWYPIWMYVYVWSKSFILFSDLCMGVCRLFFVTRCGHQSSNLFYFFSFWLSQIEHCRFRNF